MQIVGINDKTEAKRKADLLEILEKIKQQIQNDEITEIVAASIGAEGEVQIHACVTDLIGGIGLFELGKKIFIDHEE